MSNIFKKSYKIKFYETDFTQKIKTHSIVNYMQETSSLHSEVLGDGYEALGKKGMYWVVSRIKLDMIKYPKWNEEITIETWPGGLDRMFFLRSFRIYGENNEHMGDIDAAYLLIDKKSPLPYKPKEEDIPYEVIKDRFKQYKRINKIRFNKDEGELIGKRKVRYNDIDLNKHVNNAKYVEWVEDCFKTEDFKEKRISSIQVNFIKEAKEGQKILFYKYDVKEEKNSYYIQGKDKETDVELFQAKISFKNM
ncbi:acyl-ACP thioesterase domain-containing protein [Clostridium sp. ATCC 25772]|uniref:acyl-[acyl-carrier-protein] thioesterase n=1 Tax=Clostridium sp. ATCC 25772 TaxID=1676991 RepID=UPI000783F14B|nr:acyl-ACP thioesterase domain-containing protein [Clostridium sp. ATCC 25772]